MTLLKDIPGISTKLMRHRIRVLWPMRHNGRRSEIRTIVRSIKQLEA